MDPVPGAEHDNIEVTPVVVLTQTFPARPSSIPEIRDFVSGALAKSPLSEEDSRAIRETVARALLDAAGPTGAIQVSFRIFPDHVEVDVLKPHPTVAAEPGSERVPAAVGLPSERHRADRHPVDQTVDRARARPTDRSEPPPTEPADGGTFADWMAGVLRREGMTVESAARQLGVSVKTVGRWVGGATEPRLRDLRRIQELFGELPFR